jgi:hypothetical protein
MRFIVFILGGLGLLLFPAQVLAEDCEAPCAGYEISAELQNDWIFAADPSFLKSNVLQPTVTADYFFAPVDHLKWVASIITEPVIDPAPGANAAFDDVGTYVAEAYAVADWEPFALRAGKFDTILSLASEKLPGINSTNLADVFDADERLGAEASLAFEGVYLKHALSAAAFSTDRSFLGNSIITKRGKARLSDGGAGNTTGVSSFLATLSGCKGADPEDCYEDGEFGYRIGFRHQRAGHATLEQIEEELTPQSEQAFLGSATAKFDLDDEMALRFLGETAYLRHFEGGRDNALLVTGSAALERGPMNYVATYTRQLNFLAGETDTRDHLLDFEAIYSSGDDTPFDGAKWELAAAYTFERNSDGEDAHLFSLRATFDLAGSFEFGK